VVTAPAEACPACGEELIADARFCEACGAETGLAIQPGNGGSGAAEPTPGSCERCGEEVGTDGYCTSCGLRAVEPITVEDRGSYAYATHRGRRHQRNEDAAALATTSEGWPVLVVADGVSASPNPHMAAAAAVTTAAGELAGRPFTGQDDLTRAVAAAHQAACDVPADGDPHWLADDTHAACTIVVAVATPEAIHVANVGDARGYLLTGTTNGADDDDGDGDEGRWAALQLTSDDSVAAAAVREGVDAAMALTLPGGHAITAWLGADAPDPAVHLATQPAVSGDLLLVCSDGLWNYAPTDESLAEQASATLPAPGEPLSAPAKVCEELVSWAIDQGGSDNICVALTAVAPIDQEEEEE
jgi:serine/threonine protein phosphatase PrpC